MSKVLKPRLRRVINRGTPKQECWFLDSMSQHKERQGISMYLKGSSLTEGHVEKLTKSSGCRKYTRTAFGMCQDSEEILVGGKSNID